MAGRGVPIQARPATPPTVGLLSTLQALGADFYTEDDRGADTHWMGGFTWTPEACGESGTFSICADDTDLVTPSRPADRSFDPFGIWAGDTCSAMSFRNDLAGEYESRATRQLIACQSKQVAAEFWLGVIAQRDGNSNAYLRKAGAATVLGATSGVSPADGLACLEIYLADCSCGAEGMIHATRDVVSQWVEEGLIIRDGRLLRTYLNTIVIPDAGYTGSAPIGVQDNPGVSWAYATDPVMVRLGAIEPLQTSLADAMTRDVNDIEYRVSRAAAAWFDGCCLGTIGIQVPACLTVTS